MSTAILWLVPITYVLHILEKLLPALRPGLPGTWPYSARLARRLALANAPLVAYAFAVAAIAYLCPGSWAVTLGLAGACWLFLRACWDVQATLYFGVYYVGAATALFLCIPAVVVVYVAFWRAGLLAPASLLGSLAGGAAAMYLYTRLARHVGQGEGFTPGWPRLD